jgi:hypothetical protein
MPDTLDYSLDEPIVPPNEADLRLQPSADHNERSDCIVLWNDDKHSFGEVTKLIMDMTNRNYDEALSPQSTFFHCTTIVLALDILFSWNVLHF